MRRLVLAVIVAGGVAAAWLIAFGGSGTGTDTASAAAVNVAAAKTLAIHSERMKLTFETNAGSQTVHMSGDGVQDNTTHLASMTMHVDEPTQATVEERIDGSGGGIVTYVKAAGRPWQRIDVGGTMKSQGLDVSSLTQSNNDPTQVLRLVRAGASSVKKLGTETVEGTPTTHYRAHILLSRYANMYPAAQRSAAQALVQKLHDSYGMGDYDIDLWVGADKLVRRVAFTIEMSPPGVGDSSVTTEIEMYDFNLPVHITLPTVG